MANFKRRRPKNTRAGCLMCKSHKANHAKAGGEKDKLAERKKVAEREIAENRK